MTLEEQIELYCQQMTKEKILHGSNEELKDSIKSTLIDAGERTAKSGKYSVSIRITSTDMVDENRMLSILKEYWTHTYGEAPCPFIRTQEYVDADALEAFMYRESLPEDVMLDLDSCRSKKITKALTYKIAKGED